MALIKRQLQTEIEQALDRGKSILLLGPRQAGKTTLIHCAIEPEIDISFLTPELRINYERQPSLLEKEIRDYLIKNPNFRNSGKQPVVFIGEVQKVPEIMDVVQHVIDQKLARFILTGSSARKLRRGQQRNWLPGRVVVLYLDPLTVTELSSQLPSIESLLLYGSLPGIITDGNDRDREQDLSSYVSTYLEQEIREEALVRNIGTFAHFLERAASEAGYVINIAKLSQSLGISRHAVSGYFEILEDCLIAERIEPLTSGSIRKRLSKAPKYLFFDLGIRRHCANEGAKLPAQALGRLFEQFVGLELIRQLRSAIPAVKVCYWRDHNGPEVDYVLKGQDRLIPIEVKWTAIPSESDARHLLTFLEDYKEATEAYIVSNVSQSFELMPGVRVISWKQLDEVTEHFEKI